MMTARGLLVLMRYYLVHEKFLFHYFEKSFVIEPSNYSPGDNNNIRQRLIFCTSISVLLQTSFFLLFLLYETNLSCNF